MTSIRFILILLLCAFVQNAEAIQLRKLEFQVEFTPPTDSTLTHTGYKLYQDGNLVFTTTDPAVTTSESIICEFYTENGTFDFALAATYDNGSESPLSPPLTFTIGDIQSPPLESGTGSKEISYTWQPPTDIQNISGYRMYMNETMLCETDVATATSLNCYADLVNEIMNFSITSLDSGGIESDKSNFLTLDPNDFPELFQSKAITFNWEYNDGASNAGGFQVFYNGEVLCSTTDSTDRTLTCEVQSLALENEFKLAALDATGTVTFFSNLIAYSTTDSSTTDPTTEALAATIVATGTSGPAPLSVGLDGTKSTGDISSYTWDLGDGKVLTGSTVTHTYLSAGTYTATLTVNDGTNSQSATTLITVETGTATTDTPPDAVISSSTSVGEAPLDVAFDGSSSSSTTSTITTYSWDYGDGNTGAGDTTTHTFAASGSFTTELEVADANGLTDTASTPIVVSEPTTLNQSPVASFTASPNQGTVPFTVSFNGTASSDEDGSINSYYWNFGDGNTGTGSTVQHTYTTEAIYTATLQVQDDLGAKSDILSKTITALADEGVADFIYEIGELSLTHEWVQVNFDAPFTNPVVIASPPTNNDTDPTVVRIRNLTQNGFEIRLQEWDYQDNNHQNELVSYLVAEQGQITLEDGTLVEVGTFSGTMALTSIPFKQEFLATPIVLTSILSENETSAVAGRLKDVSTTSFSYQMQEEEAADRSHIDETIGYIAWEQGIGNNQELTYEATTLANTTHKWNTATFTQDFSTQPFVFVDMQTKNGGDTSSLRINTVTKSSIELKVAEEQSKDTELNHAKETIGLVAIGPSGTSIEPDEVLLITFSWEFDTSQESQITGFRLYVNDQLICEAAPNLRSAQCETQLKAGINQYTMKTVDLRGQESTVSNALEHDYLTNTY